jgi:hypothetical protein
VVLRGVQVRRAAFELDFARCVQLGSEYLRMMHESFELQVRCWRRDREKRE